jgi:hypothetical protein
VSGQKHSRLIRRDDPRRRDAYPTEIDQRQTHLFAAVLIGPPIGTISLLTRRKSSQNRVIRAARQRCAQRIAVLTLTRNRPAADRAEAPAAATRSRESPEYGAGTLSPNDMLGHHLRRSPALCKTFSFRIYLFGNRSNWDFLSDFSAARPGMRSVPRRLRVPGCRQQWPHSGQPRLRAMEEMYLPD